MYRKFQVSVLSVIALSLLASPQSLAFTIVLIPNDCHLASYDPLFVKVVMRNEDEDSFILDAPPGAEYGSIQFEVRSLNTAGYKPVDAVAQGTHAYEGPPIRLLPGQEYASHELLYLELPVGILQLRARIGNERSPPVLLFIRSRSAVQQQFITNNATFLSYCVNLEGLADPDITAPERIEKSLRKLSVSNLRNTLEWYLLLVNLRQASNEMQQRKLERKLARLRRGLDPVTNEIIANLLAYHYMKENELDKALKTLEIIEHDTQYKTSMLHEIRYLQALNFKDAEAD